MILHSIKAAFLEAFHGTTHIVQKLKPSTGVLANLLPLSDVEKCTNMAVAHQPCRSSCYDVIIILEAKGLAAGLYVVDAGRLASNGPRLTYVYVEVKASSCWIKMELATVAMAPPRL